MTETTSGPAGRKGKGSRKGIRVRRVFTTPGTHPYDSLEWERRDVVMTNWRDGTVNFEQRGVEFPSSWSMNATQIVTSKYFRGAVGTPEREWSLKQLIDRVVGVYTETGREHGYFASAEDAEVFDHELKHALAHQLFSFNSPVWFNVGTNSKAQVSACFILSVDDTMESILDWYKEEGIIFKGGSGAGVNLSRIRSSKELLSSGGTASGPVSFMRGADASAGTIKSGGATRRAAKMVVLDVDHPDIEDFVETKAREEHKIRALRDAGFDVDLGGDDMFSVQYQNANNSVRVSDAFMRAVESGSDFGLTSRTTGEVVATVDAKELFQRMARAAWECADPGIQYDGTIQDWHTTPESGRISASNPCFPADQRVLTDRGHIPIGDLIKRAARGETFAVYTNDITAETDAQNAVVATIPTQYMVTGTNEILELRFSDGSLLRCTPNHRLWTENRGWVHAEKLLSDDRVVRSFQYAPRSNPALRIPRAALEAVRTVAALPSVRPLYLPEKWDEDPDLAHYLGWLVGDGSVGDQAVVTVYGTAEEQQNVLPRHQALIERLTGHRSKPSLQPNGTQQLRITRRTMVEFVRALGLGARAEDKSVPPSLFEAPEETVLEFLQGLFDADGCAVDQKANGTRYIGLGSRSDQLLRDVQELLAPFGIASRVYRTSEGKPDSFSYTRKDGSTVTYGSDGPFFDLRISAQSMQEFSALVNFSLEGKSEKLREALDFRRMYRTRTTTRLFSRRSAGFETTYNLTEPRNHSYIVGGTVVANCSEYMSLDDSSCNLASINLLKFLREDDTFDVERFTALTELVITAMDVSITFADFPTEKIGETTRAYRQLGIGYANLGALLMATGHAYDSEGGRAVAAAVTSLMTGTAYRRSAELAGVVGPYDGYRRNERAHKRVMRKHAAANDDLRTVGTLEEPIHAAATREWAECLRIGERNGWRNAQASLLAPTGCLTGDSMVTTDRGLVRLTELGDAYGPRWQDLSARVSTDEGPREATRFFVNGEEPTRRIVTRGGYRLQGTHTHRIKVVSPRTGDWEWKRFADIAEGDVVPVQMGTLVGQPRRVVLPVLDQAYYTGDHDLFVPEAVDEELAELVGYFMGDGSLHAKGIRMCVADTDEDVVERLRILAKGLFGLAPTVTAGQGYQEVTLSSVRLARWWKAAGFAKDLPGQDHSGKGWTPRVPSSVLETNDPAVYAAFLRGLFEADGTVLEGVPSISTAHASFAGEVRTLLLTLGMASTTRTTRSGYGGDCHVVRLRNVDHALRFDETVGFLGDRKNKLVVQLESDRSAKGDRIVLPRQVWDELVPVGHAARGTVVQSLRKYGGVARQLASAIHSETLDGRLGHALGYVFEEVGANEDGGVQPTYDISVPDNVTYVANGLVSHNTIGFMMDCDTTGIEPDFSLVKFKKLVGGGSMQIVNQAIPRALGNLGYQDEQIEAVVEYVSENGHVVDAPGLRAEHYEVFDCAMGLRYIRPMGHVRMMAAVQPFLSGAISKTVNVPEEASVEDFEHIYFEGWRMGLKALAVYRDNCKVGQPLSTGGTWEKEAGPEAEAVEAPRPVRRRLPKKRPSETTSFSVGGAEGYITAGSYPDDGLGEVFMKLGKQGSTLAGVMDAFSIAISIALQYGVPLETYVEKFTNMRFDPAGMTDDPDIRMAQSVVDYIFRRLALDHLPYEERAALGVLSAAERQAQVAGEDPAQVATQVESYAQSAATRGADAPEEVPAASAREPHAAAERPTRAHSTAELMEGKGFVADAPLCMTCGTKMRPSGSCYACEGCGATSGCS
ncbi:LAGLIDADG family homing endonuclease [Nocardiopsis sp. LDBS0036]|uniref:LAGLIDADG family homing endonuclease n=1 Tax=Nocardiopsis sp. LDBS0036 TaxID=3104276 RepID=UPI003511A58B